MGAPAAADDFSAVAHKTEEPNLPAHHLESHPAGPLSLHSLALHSISEDDATEDLSAPSSSLSSAWQTSQHVKNESRHIYNKLWSIYEDSKFVESVARTYPRLPLTANLRCGAWYTAPSLTTQVSYFKSTDGHTHQWDFSLKRANLHLLPTILANHGTVIVDATRRGKSMPDALSKTVPLWCAVLNAASVERYGAFPRNDDDGPTDGEEQNQAAGLRTHAKMVSPSEHQQIQTRVPEFVQRLLASDLPVPRLAKPLRPVFVTPKSILPLAELDHPDQLTYIPIVLVSASRLVTDSQELLPSSSSALEQHRIYVQGAGDDHENWARGLTPQLFWTNVEPLLAASRDEISDVVDSIVARASTDGQDEAQWFRPARFDLATTGDHQTPAAESQQTSHKRLGDTQIYLDFSHSRTVAPTDEERETFGLVVFCSAPAHAQSGATTIPDSDTQLGRARNRTDDGETHTTDAAKSAKAFYLNLPEGKRGAASLIRAFPDVIDPCLTSLAASRPILLASKGSDLASSLAIVLLSLGFDGQTRCLLPTAEARRLQSLRVDKDTTRRRLQWLVTCLPHAAPSRSFLLRINDLLIGGRYRDHQRGRNQS